MFNQEASQDFDRAMVKSFWRRVLAWMTRRSNELLPFDEVREKVRIRGQHYLGLDEVPIDQIIGSEGRYHDFDRVFLPLQTHTKQRWISIDLAHLEDIRLPPVELYKIGEVYFVKDGNHRVSVARQRGQLFIDAYVTEIDIPVPFTLQTSVDELVIQQERLEFLERTQLDVLRPGAQVKTRAPGQYRKLLEHIDVHRWYMGEQRRAEVPPPEAAVSWYDHVYLPLVKIIRTQEILPEFPQHTETDLYLWIMDYKWYLRLAYRGKPHAENGAASPLSGAAKEIAGKQAAGESPGPPVRKLIEALKRAQWIDDLILREERAAFLEATQIQSLRPEVQIETSVPGQYDHLLEHISVHRWYLGEQRHSDVPYSEAVASWYDRVYAPLVTLLCEQGLLARFPGRTETDLYLWVLSRQWILKQEYGAGRPGVRTRLSLLERIIARVKRLAGRKPES